MSTDRSRLVSSIRRIVLTDPDLSSALDAWQNRGDQASSTGTGTSDAERDRLCCDGSTSENPNPGADTRDTSEGGQDGLNEDDPALLDSGPGSLTGVTDCATGEPICFDGSDWLPPEGWDGPNDPPVDDEWIEGSYYQADVQSTVYHGDTPSQAYSSAPGSIEINGNPYSKVFYEINNPPNGYIQYERDSDGSLAQFGLTAADCESGSFECADEPPTLDSWPEDGCTNLAIKNGTIVGSKFDPENDGTYSKPMSEIELCDEFGNSFFLSPASNGGWKTIDSTKTDGYLYDSQGNKIAHIDGNEYADPDV